MNNGYNYNPEFIRNSFYMPVQRYQMPTNVPRISSLFTGIRTGNGTFPGASKITFSSILNGTSKTLGVINQAIPVFYQVKPIWRNAKTMFRVVKGLNSKDDVPANEINEKNKLKSNKKEASGNAPTFFM